MQITIKNNGVPTKINLPDDYTISEFYAELKNMPMDATVAEIQNSMANSNEALVSKSGETISFRDYAGANTTLASLGVSSDEIYEVRKNAEANGISG